MYPELISVPAHMAVKNSSRAFGFASLILCVFFLKTSSVFAFTYGDCAYDALGYGATTTCATTATTTPSTPPTITTTSSGGGGGGGGGGGSVTSSITVGAPSVTSSTTVSAVTTANTTATIASLQSLLASLLAQVKAKGIVLTGTTATLPTTGSVSSGGSITHDLTIGSQGAEVQNLQKILNKLNFTIAKSGVGSPGNEGTYFGPATRVALIHLQKQFNISPATGYFGAKTRAVLQAKGLL